MVKAIIIGLIALYLVIGIMLLIKSCQKQGVSPSDAGSFLTAIFLWPFFLKDLLS